MQQFKIKAEFEPAGDQIKAIGEIAGNLEKGLK